MAGFHLGSVLHEVKCFELPLVPPEFVERHQTAEQQRDKNASAASQAAVPAPHFPADEDLKKRIDSVAVFVAKGGVMSEELARQEHTGDDSFSFLFGGDGSEYYRWKLLDVKVTFQKLGVKCSGVREAPLTADDRGFLLGDEKIKEHPIQSRAVSHPFIQGVPEADRDRVKSALKSTFVKGATEGVLHTDQSESGLRASRPKEALQPEEETPEKPQPQPADLTPVRSFVDWHAVPLLYKRFNVLDPLKGMPREAESKSKFMSYESGLDQVKTEEAVAAVTDAPTVSIADEVDVCHRAFMAVGESVLCRLRCLRQNTQNHLWTCSNLFLILVLMEKMNRNLNHRASLSGRNAFLLLLPRKRSHWRRHQVLGSA